MKISEIKATIQARAKLENPNKPYQPETEELCERLLKAGVTDTDQLSDVLSEVPVTEPVSSTEKSPRKKTKK